MKDKQALVSAVLLLHCAVAVGTPRLTEPAIVVAAATGTVLHAEAANQRWAPASLAKLMTLYLVFEALQAGELAANDRLTVSRVAAAQQPVRLGLRSGQALTVAEAIAAVAMVSANDVAVALAERLAGSEARFAALMTATARRLGMTRTVFATASGLPAAGQFTTARDMALLARVILERFPARSRVFSARSFRFDGRALTSTNTLLGSYRGADGMKTGFTCAAGYNLVASAQRNGRRLIGVVLGSGTRGERDRRMMKLLDSGFERPVTLAPRTDLSALQPSPEVDIGPPPRRLPGDSCAQATDGTRISGWGMLLGVYTERAAARAAVARARRALRGVMGAGRPAYLPRKLANGTSWKTLMVGLRREQVGRGCKHLWQSGITCVPQSPEMMKHPRYALR